jgi:hypothetical protein
VSPLAFLRAVKTAGLKTFDAWAHHPYYGSPRDTPTTEAGGPERRPDRGDARQHRHADHARDAALRQQARSGSPSTATRRIRPTRSSASPGRSRRKYLKQAFAIARANPRIDLMLWFLLKDEPTSTAGSRA